MDNVHGIFHILLLRGTLNSSNSKVPYKPCKILIVNIIVLNEKNTLNCGAIVTAENCSFVNTGNRC